MTDADLQRVSDNVGEFLNSEEGRSNRMAANDNGSYLNRPRGVSIGDDLYIRAEASEDAAIHGALLLTGEAAFAYGAKGIQLLRASANGSRAFWSGGSQAKAAAEVWAKANGAITLETGTLFGRILDKITTKQTFKYLEPLWNMASKRFAQGAEGAANVFQSGSRGVRIESVWATREYPILLQKGNEIIYHVAK